MHGRPGSEQPCAVLAELAELIELGMGSKKDRAARGKLVRVCWSICPHAKEATTSIEAKAD